MPKTANSIISPVVDFLCCGGLSIFVILGLLIVAPALPSGTLSDIHFEQILLLHVLINWPHFMASYRLLYRSKEQIVTYRWASVYVPAILVALVAYALWTPSSDVDGSDFANGLVLDVFVGAAMFLLAWHYTGQAWGMTASFSYLAGIRINGSERRLVRSGYRALLVWHILWALTGYQLTPALGQWLAKTGMVGGTSGEIRSQVDALYHGWGVVVLLTFIAGIIGFLKIRSRTGITPPLRAVVPWLAIYLWYILILIYPGAFPVLQISHALQYIIFPVRVEMNRYESRTHSGLGRQRLHAVIYFASLVVIGVLIHKGPELAKYWGDFNFELRDLVVGSVNLHHYFIDGAIWKISNPLVRKDLFAHLP